MHSVGEIVHSAERIVWRVCGVVAATKQVIRRTAEYVSGNNRCRVVMPHSGYLPLLYRWRLLLYHLPERKITLGICSHKERVRLGRIVCGGNWQDCQRWIGCWEFLLQLRRLQQRTLDSLQTLTICPSNNLADVSNRGNLFFLWPPHLRCLKLLLLSDPVCYTFGNTTIGFLIEFSHKLVRVVQDNNLLLPARRPGASNHNVM